MLGPQVNMEHIDVMSITLDGCIHTYMLSMPPLRHVHADSNLQIKTLISIKYGKIDVHAISNHYSNSHVK
jgi:hypothetical protein